MDSDIFALSRGTAPLLVSFPHAGTAIPPELEGRMTPAALQRADVDWHLPQLYEFARALGLRFPILSDESRDTARAYGVLTRSGFTSRWTFYIGLDGRILDIDKHVETASHGRDVAARLSELGIS